MSSAKVDIMTRARANLVLEHPFFGVLGLRTQMVPKPGLGTAATDGFKIMYDPEFVKGLSQAQATGLLVHELYHKVFMHHLRRGARDPKKWNIACDYAINPLVMKIPRVELPDGGCVDPQYNGMYAEEIYDKLPPDICSKFPNNGSDPGGCGGVVDYDSSSGMTPAEAEAQIKQQIAQAVHTAKQRGNLPAGMDIYLDELLEPQVPWRQQLRRFMTERARAEFSWSKPNRRFIGMDLYLPSMSSEDAAGEFAFGVDTSGSMLGVLPIVMSEVNGVMEEVQPLRSHVIYCDAAVGRHDIFERGEELEVQPNGGGGTDFRPVFDKIEEEGLRPKCLIFITDGYGTFPEEEPPYPVLWVMTENVEPPFGESIRIEA